MTLANWWLQVGNYHLQGQTATCQWLFATTNWQWPNVNCHRTSRALAQLHERTTPPYYSLPSLLTPLTTDSLTHYSITTHSPHYSLTHSLTTHSLLTPLTTHSLTHYYSLSTTKLYDIHWFTYVRKKREICFFFEQVSTTILVTNLCVPPTLNLQPHLKLFGSLLPCGRPASNSIPPARAILNPPWFRPVRYI